MKEIELDDIEDKSVLSIAMRIVGRKGGQVRSEKKRRAVRENLKKARAAKRRIYLEESLND